VNSAEQVELRDLGIRGIVVGFDLEVGISSGTRRLRAGALACTRKLENGTARPRDRRGRTSPFSGDDLGGEHEPGLPLTDQHQCVRGQHLERTDEATRRPIRSECGDTPAIALLNADFRGRDAKPESTSSDPAYLGVPADEDRAHELLAIGEFDPAHSLSRPTDLRHLGFREADDSAVAAHEQ